MFTESFDSLFERRNQSDLYRTPLVKRSESASSPRLPHLLRQTPPRLGQKEPFLPCSERNKPLLAAHRRYPLCFSVVPPEVLPKRADVVFTGRLGFVFVVVEVHDEHPRRVLTLLPPPLRALRY